jgi:hypothetical protein
MTVNPANRKGGSIRREIPKAEEEQGKTVAI